MPSKIIPFENYLNFSVLRNNNMGNNNNNNVLEINNNFVDLLYVFDRPSLNPNEPNQSPQQPSRLESMQDILEQQEDEPETSSSSQNPAIDKQFTNRLKFDRNSFNRINLQKINLESSIIKNRFNRESSLTESLINLKDGDDQDKQSKVFSPAFINGKFYRPTYGLHNSLLYNGSKFVGHQKSKGTSYHVEVVIQHVDIDNLYICGHLKIKGLVDEYPNLVTFFDGEIISEKYNFLTRKYDADFEIDRKHWSK